MTFKTSTTLPAFSADGAANAATASTALGNLPTWKLSDLYPSAASPEYKAALEKAQEGAKAFEAKWKGKLQAAAELTGEKGLGAALKEYEALDDLLGRIGSFAGLTYFPGSIRLASARREVSNQGAAGRKRFPARRRAPAGPRIKSGVTEGGAGAAGFG